MHTLLMLFASLPLVAGVAGGFGDAQLKEVFRSVEIGVAELSPAGERGGFAVPASSGSCFTADTLVATPEGDVPIKDIEAGDVVYSYDERGLVETVVEDLLVHDGDDALLHNYDQWPLLSVRYDDGTETSVTAGHPIYSVSNDTWKPIEEFEVGEQVRDVSGGVKTIVSFEEKGGQPVVYNLIIDHPSHNYFADGVLVHNGIHEFLIPTAEAQKGGYSQGKYYSQGTYYSQGSYTPSQADLTTTNVALNSGTLEVGDDLTFSATINNVGTAASSLLFYNSFGYRYNSGDSWTLISAETQTQLSASQSAQNISNSVSFPTAGDVEIGVCADVTDLTSESNESNNCASRVFTIVAQPQPDLTTSNIVLNSGTLEVGDDTTFRGTVSNGGTASTGSGFDDQFSYRYGTSGAFTSLSTVSKSALAAGNNSTDTSGSLNLTTSGTLQIQLCADSGSAISESNESNNCTTQSFTVSAPPSPSVTLDIREVGVGSWANDVTVDFGVDVELQWSSTDADRCVGDSYFSTGGGQPTSGTQGTVSEPSSGSRVYQVTCHNDTYSTQNSDTATVNINAPAGDPTITVDPGRVQQGDPADIDFNTGGNANCVINGTNGDFFDLQALFPGQQTGTVQSGPINAETEYTISCDTGTPGTATARIFPVFEEI